MNILAIFSVIIATVNMYMLFGNLKKKENSKLKIWIVLLEFSIGWWCLFYALFYSAPDKEAAMRWHKIASLGWSYYSAFGAMYFIGYTGGGESLKKPLRAIGFFIPATLVFFSNICFPGSLVARSLVRSQSGLGWVYISDPKSFGYWFLVAEQVLYFGVIVVHVAKFRKNKISQLKKNVVFGYIGLVYLIITLGMITDFVLPHFITHVPPLSGILAGLFTTIYFAFLQRYDICNPEDIISSRDILETCSDPVLLIDGWGEIIRCNQATCRMLEMEKYEILGTDFVTYLDNTNNKDAFVKVLYGVKKVENFQMKYVSGSGISHNLDVSATVVWDKRNELQGIVISMYDVTEMIRASEQLKDANERYKELADELFSYSYYDQLTGIPNRRMYLENLENQRGDFAVIYIDLDGFKKVNDTWGHKVGDKILIRVAEILQEEFQAPDMTARIGGDEFAAYVQGVKSEKEVKERIRNIEKKFAEEAWIDENPCRIGLSAGYAFSKQTKDVKELIKAADLEMYQNKKENRK